MLFAGEAKLRHWHELHRCKIGLLSAVDDLPVRGHDATVNACGPSRTARKHDQTVTVHRYTWLERWALHDDVSGFGWYERKRLVERADTPHSQARVLVQYFVSPTFIRLVGAPESLEKGTRTALGSSEFKCSGQVTRSNNNIGSAWFPLVGPSGQEPEDARHFLLHSTDYRGRVFQRKRASAKTAEHR